MKQILLEQGESWNHIFKGMGSPAYTWEWSVEGPEDIIAVAVSSVGERPVTPPGHFPDSYVLDTKITVSGVSPGRVRLRLYLSLPFDDETPPLKEEIWDVLVK